ncbi:sulfate reduction electron transfer complex DsrMKJOP subunit DsrJ [Candidatus Hydrogenedentota bacterium]
MKLYDGNKIIPAMVGVFVLLIFPIWYNMAVGTGGSAPELVMPEDATNCVLPAEEMRESHMVLLKKWRDDVVRDGDRIYVSADGNKYVKSLSNTCWVCHNDKKNFCHKCHDYAGVKPDCGDCHVTPKENSHELE